MALTIRYYTRALKKFLLPILDDDEETLIRRLSKRGTEIRVSNLGDTPLLTAVRFHKARMVDTILRFPSTKVNAVDSFGYTSLHLACDSQSPSIEIIRKLLAHNADVNLCNKDKVTPLMTASFNRSIPVMNLLIEAGARFDRIDLDGCTFVHYALESRVLQNFIYHNPKPQLMHHGDLPDQILFDAIIYPGILEKIIKKGEKISGADVVYVIRVLMNTENKFNFAWRNMDYKSIQDPYIFIKLFHHVFKRSKNVTILKRRLKMIMNTTDFNINLAGKDLVCRKIFDCMPDPRLKLNSGKNTLLAFCQYLNRHGCKLSRDEVYPFLIYFVERCKCKFVAELLAVFYKYNSELSVTMHLVVNSSVYNDLKLTSLLLSNCHDFDKFFYRPKIISVEMLKFLLRRFTPSKYETSLITKWYPKFNVHVKRLKVPSLTEISRNAVRRAMKNKNIKEIIDNLVIPLNTKSILYFKTPVNKIE